MEPCNHEEADTRLLLHVLDASLKGFNKISIVTVDTDVVVIALFHFFDMNIAELWIEIGVGQYRRWLPIHTYARCLKEEICRALPFWFALTGCDTVSMFAGRGKKTAWSVWEVYPEVTESFVRVATEMNEISKTDFEKIERYVVLLYDRTSLSLNVNECRRNLFTKKARAVEAIPPTKDALEQHVRRAILQSRIWTSATKKLIYEFDITKWGWQKNERSVNPLWMTLPEASKACFELVKCSCKTKCSARCRCKKQSLPCTELCGCGGGCK